MYGNIKSATGGAKIDPKGVRLGGGGGACSAERYHLTRSGLRFSFHRKTVIVDGGGGQDIAACCFNIQLDLDVFPRIVNGLTGYKVTINQGGAFAAELLNDASGGGAGGRDIVPCAAIEDLQGSTVGTYNQGARRSGGGHGVAFRGGHPGRQKALGG